jgi:glycosyltransferase involved in cell wall biosynthesis
MGGEVVRFVIRRWAPVALHCHFSNYRPPTSPRGWIMTFLDFAMLFWGWVLFSKVIRQVKPDLVYANEHVMAHACLVARAMGIPSVIHIRSRMVGGKLAIRRRMAARMILASCAHVFAISRREAAQLETKHRESKVHVVGEFAPMNVPERDPRSAVMAEHGIRAGNRIVLMVGGIAEIKGTLVFLEAARTIAARTSDVTFVIVGTDQRGAVNQRGYFEKCMEQATELRKTNAIVLTGEVDDPIALLAASDIVVSPSTASHFSRPVIEAWAVSKPVVASDTEHMREVVVHGTNGLLFPTGNHAALATCIETLLSDSTLRLRLGQEGRKKVAAEFDADTNLAEIVRWCEALCDSPLRSLGPKAMP